MEGFSALSGNWTLLILVVLSLHAFSLTFYRISFQLLLCCLVIKVGIVARKDTQISFHYMQF